LLRRIAWQCARVFVARTFVLIEMKGNLRAFCTNECQHAQAEVRDPDPVGACATGPYRLTGERMKRSRYATFPGAGIEDVRKYFDGGNTPAFVSSRPTRVRISSVQSAQVSSLIPRCRRAALYSAPPR
jgi:hypothetical protein